MKTGIHSTQAGKPDQCWCGASRPQTFTLNPRYWSNCVTVGLFPTLAVGLLDFKVDVVLARLEADFSDQPPSITAVPNRRVSLQCRTTKYPCSAQPMSIPAMLNGCAHLQSVPAVPKRRVSLQCPTAEYPYLAQPQSIPAVPNCRVSLRVGMLEVSNFDYFCIHI